MVSRNSYHQGLLNVLIQEPLVIYGSRVSYLQKMPEPTLMCVLPCCIAIG